MPDAPLPSRPDTSPPPSTLVEVWDLPVRIFHWLLVALLVTAAISGKMGGNAMDIHLQAGYCIAVLVVFRLLWGFVGTAHARFATFVRGVPSVVAYCRQLWRGEDYPHRGHNPLGGWMVVLMLLALAVQAGTGLFANDDIMAEGPLIGWVGKDTSDWLTAIHKLNFKVLAALAGLHVLAIGFYLAVKRINLVRPMITGRMAVAAGQAASGRPFPRYTNLMALALVAALAGGLYLLIPTA